MIKKDFSSSLTENEYIIKQVDKHWIVYAFSFIFILFFLLLCFFLFLYRGEIEYNLGNGLFWGGFSLCSVIIFSFVIFTTLGNLLTTILVTNNRIIAYERSIPFGYHVEYISLGDITEIHGESRGILPTLFGYGTLSIGYMGGTQKIHLSFAENPTECLQAIHTLKETAKKVA